MRVRLLDAPWWVLAMISGVPFGTFLAVVDIVAHGAPVVSAIVGAAVGAVFFGVFMGLFQARLNRRARAAVGEVPADRAAAVHRAATRGPVPDDPDERAAAARLVAHQLEQVRRYAWWSVAVFGALLLMSAWLAVSSSPWWWAAVVMWCGLIGWTLWLPSHLRKRLAVLEA